MTLMTRMPKMEYQFKTINHTFKGIAKLALNGGLNEGTSRNKCQAFDVRIEIADPVYNLKVHPLNLGISTKRWYKFLCKYAEPDSFEYFLLCAADLNNNSSQSYVCPTYGNHGRGNCLLGVSVHRQKSGKTLVMYSDRCLWAPTSYVDLSFASLVAQRTGCDRIVWYINSLELTAERAMYLTLLYPKWDKGPFFKAIHRYIDNQPKDRDDIGFATRRNALKTYDRMKERGLVDYKNKTPDLDEYLHIAPSEIAYLLGMPRARGRSKVTTAAKKLFGLKSITAFDEESDTLAWHITGEELAELLSALGANVSHFTIAQLAEARRVSSSPTDAGHV